MNQIPNICVKITSIIDFKPELDRTKGMLTMLTYGNTIIRWTLS